MTTSVTDTNHQDRLLTEDERESWDADGYLLLKGALDPEQLTRIRAGVDDTVDAFEAATPEKRAQHFGTAGNSNDLRVKNIAQLSPCLDELLDHEPVFRRALSLMGPYVQVCGTEILLRQPRTESALSLHLDGGAALTRMMPHAGTPLSHLKALYFLTDLAGSNCGNVVVVPGSHRIPLPETVEGLHQHPALARQRELVAEAGDVLLFSSNLWHSVGANRTDMTRVSAVVWYSQLWARPIDYDKMPDDVLARLTPRRRLLLGGLPSTTPNSYYLPASPDYLSTMLAGLPRDAPEFSMYLDDRVKHDWENVGVPE